MIWLWCRKSGSSRATARPGRNIPAGPVWEENLWILLSKMAHSGALYIFWATAGPPKVSGPGKNFPSSILYPVLDGPAAIFRSLNPPIHFATGRHFASFLLAWCSCTVAHRCFPKLPKDIDKLKNLVVPGPNNETIDKQDLQKGIKSVTCCDNIIRSKIVNKYVFSSQIVFFHMVTHKKWIMYDWRTGCGKKVAP